jgi:hypothetical protein
MRISRPVLQTGHRRDNCSSMVESRLPGGSALAAMTICEAGSKDRHSASFSFRRAVEAAFCRAIKREISPARPDAAQSGGLFQ